MNKQTQFALIFVGGAVTALTIRKKAMSIEFKRNSLLDKAIRDGIAEFKKTLFDGVYKAIFDDKTQVTCDDIKFDTRRDAELVLDGLIEIIHERGEASIADFYDMAGVKGYDRKYSAFGWKNLFSAKIIRTYNGYYIKFPDVINLT